MIPISSLFEAADGRCFYCDCDTYIPGRQTRYALLHRFGVVKGASGSRKALRYRQATHEHLQRVADGGGSCESNLVLACAFCNAHRGEATPEHHRSVMAQYIAAGLHPNHDLKAGISKRGTWRERRDLRALLETTDLQSDPPSPKDRPHA